MQHDEFPEESSTPSSNDLGKSRIEGYKKTGRNFSEFRQQLLKQVAPFIMLICTAFTLQCIGYSALDSWHFLRMIGGTVAMVGVFFPLVFYGDMNTKVLILATVISFGLTVAISMGYLCGCNCRGL